MKVSVILACAGKGERAGFNKNKLLVKTNGQTVLEKTFNAFYSSGLVDEIIVALSKTDFEEVKSILGDKAILCLGGETRTQSIKNALKLVSGDIVLIHDGARPFIDKDTINACITCASENGSAITVFPTRNTMCKVADDKIANYLGKSQLYSVQTPQGFKTELIKKAYDLAGDNVFNDDGEVYKNYIGEVFTVLGKEENVKITFKNDINLLDNALSVRVGVGFDCHKLVENRKLILGGVVIPHDKGLLGHSDADVLTHAIMDAILSSISERDIGYHFPDTDPQYKGADSIVLLKKVLEIANDKGYKVAQVSASIMAEKPKLKPFIPEITKNLASVLTIAESEVGIGATTLEGLGFVGREEGICVHASATLTKI